MASTTWAGRRTVRALSATARVTAWRIHHVAYVEKRLPISGSNFSTARIRPALPSWIRSSKSTPRPLYFLAIEITSRRLHSISRRLATVSPSRARRLRSFSSCASRSLPSRILPRYCVRTSCAICVILLPLSSCQRRATSPRPHVLLARSSRITPSPAESREPIAANSLGRRVGAAGPRPRVHHEAVQDAVVEAGGDPPAPPARAPETEPPALAGLGQRRLLEGAQAARRQRLHVDLRLSLARRRERSIRPEGAPLPHVTPFRLRARNGNLPKTPTRRAASSPSARQKVTRRPALPRVLPDPPGWRRVRISRPTSSRCSFHTRSSPIPCNAGPPRPRRHDPPTPRLCARLAPASGRRARA